MNGAKHRFALGLTCFFLIGITVVYPFLLYTPNASSLAGVSGTSKPQWAP